MSSRGPAYADDRNDREAGGDDECRDADSLHRQWRGRRGPSANDSPGGKRDAHRPPGRAQAERCRQQRERRKHQADLLVWPAGLEKREREHHDQARRQPEHGRQQADAGKVPRACRSAERRHAGCQGRNENRGDESGGGEGREADDARSQSEAHERLLRSSARRAATSASSSSSSSRSRSPTASIRHDTRGASEPPPSTAARTASAARAESNSLRVKPWTVDEGAALLVSREHALPMQPIQRRHQRRVGDVRKSIREIADRGRRSRAHRASSVRHSSGPSRAVARAGSVVRVNQKAMEGRHYMGYFSVSRYATRASSSSARSAGTSSTTSEWPADEEVRPPFQPYASSIGAGPPATGARPRRRAENGCCPRFAIWWQVAHFSRS